MNRIPQNDPGFLSFQRNLRARNRKRRLRRAAIIAATVVLILSLLTVGVVAIYRAGEKPAADDDRKNDGVTDNNDLSSGGSGNGQNNGDNNNGDSNNNNNDDNNNNTDDNNDNNNNNNNDNNDSGEKKIVVYVDAGHGFTNSEGVIDKGAGYNSPYYTVSGGKLESDMNLEVALKLKEVLLEKGYEVIMSRETEVFEHVTVDDRVNMANASNADIFVSVHANASDSASAKGARVYYSTYNDGASDCKKYASAVASALNAVEGASLNNVDVFDDRPNVAVIKGVNVPTVLVETCFMTNAEDAALAVTEEWQLAMATGICNGITNYLALA